MQYSSYVCYVASLGAQILWIWVVLPAAIKAPHIEAPGPDATQFIAMQQEKKANME